MRYDTAQQILRPLGSACLFATGAAIRERRSDDDLQTEVMNAFHFDLALPRDRLSVRVEHGSAILDGTVVWPYQKDCAEIDAGNVVGAERVINRITIDRTQ